MRELEREPTDKPLPALAVIGPGRLGGAILRAADGAGLDVRLAGREDSLAACESASVALICVPDASITSAGEAVAAAVPPLRYVGHTSGATGLDALRAASERGAETFVLHPLQTIPEGEARLDDAPCAVSGSSPAALELAKRLAEGLGMVPFELADADRAAYHAAASIASNFLVALEESAAGLLAASGVADPRELLAPLVLRTAANWAERGPEALTGPIARGDERTVERHVEAIAERAPELLPLYEALAERTRELARLREVAV
jgi:predicted short-subunit dehydrogenase-like oxidoreductase (DUF2520 family)